MVAHPGPDVLILVLTCTVTVRLLSTGHNDRDGCPADTGRKWLPAALCAQYVPKFCLLRCSASTTAVWPSWCPYQFRGEQAGISSYISRDPGVLVVLDSFRRWVYLEGTNSSLF
jgi:hypothetical protein